jgi:hypothetical protein
VRDKDEEIPIPTYNASNERREKEEDEENVSRHRTRASDESWRSGDNDGWGVQRQRQRLGGKQEMRMMAGGPKMVRVRLAGLLRDHNEESEILMKVSRDQEGTKPRLI